MLKVKPPEGYPPEEGRYARGNDYSPVAVCVILDDFDFNVPAQLQELVMAGLDAGAALSGMLQTENLGVEKILCNIVANPNIRYIVLCGRESPGHMPGEALLLLKQSGVDDKKQIIGSTAPTPYLHNIPNEVIDRFREQIVTIIDLLCRPGEKDRKAPGLDPETIEKAVWICIQESPVPFMGYSLYDIGACSEPPIVHKIVARVTESRWELDPEGRGVGHMVAPGLPNSRMAMGLMLQKFLPQTNCQECGRRTCLAFAIDLAKGKCGLEACPVLDRPESAADRSALTKLLE